MTNTYDAMKTVIRIIPRDERFQAWLYLEGMTADGNSINSRIMVAEEKTDQESRLAVAFFGAWVSTSAGNAARNVFPEPAGLLMYPTCCENGTPAGPCQECIDFCEAMQSQLGITPEEVEERQIEDRQRADMLETAQLQLVKKIAKNTKYANNAEYIAAKQALRLSEQMTTEGVRSWKITPESEKTGRTQCSKSNKTRLPRSEPGENHASRQALQLLENEAHEMD